MWLRLEENKKRFRMPVIEPAALSVEVRDPRYAAAVEAAFNPVQLKVCRPSNPLHTKRSMISIWPRRSYFNATKIINFLMSL